MTKGRIVQVMGPVVDVEFNSKEELPFIKDALEVDNGGRRCVCLLYTSYQPYSLDSLTNLAISSNVIKTF